MCPETIGIGVNRDGAFADYLVLPETNVWPIHNDIPSDIASIFDPLGNAMHSALSHDIIGEDVLITGAGPIGLMAIKICKMIGARNVVITDINDYRLLLAESYGVSKAININKEELKTHYSTLKMINGFDVGLEMSVVPQL